MSWAHHLGGQPVRGAGPGSCQASGGRRVTPGNRVVEARGPEGRLRSRGPRLPVLSQCSPAIRGSTHMVGISRRVACVCFSLSVVFSGRPGGSECQDFAPFWLSDAPPCGLGLLVTDGHSPWRLCRCGRAWRGFCTDTCCHFSCVGTQNQAAGIHRKFTFNCLRSCQAVLHDGCPVSQTPSHAGRALVSPHPPHLPRLLAGRWLCCSDRRLPRVRRAPSCLLHAHVSFHFRVFTSLG